MARIPLARLQLTAEKRRLAAALAGISFAVVLMLMQLGLRAALLEAAVLHYNLLRADLVIINPQYEYLVASKSFYKQRLYQTLAFDQVESVTPVYLGLVPWKDPVSGEETSLLLMGFDPRSKVFRAEGVQENLKLIEMPDVVLFDINSHAVRFGSVGGLFQKNGFVETELAGRRVTVKGTFKLGIGFAALGNVVTSDMNFLRILPHRDQDLIDVGLIQLKPGTSVEEMQKRIASYLPSDVKVLTKQQFMDYEAGFWNAISPIGFVFGLGAVMGFVVGSVIVYQILYTDVADHLSEYATLKAIGYRDSELFSVVLKESLLLSILGYLPGVLTSHLLYVVTVRATGLPVYMTPERALLVFLFTVVMCSASGALAMRRIRTADPAEIF